LKNIVHNCDCMEFAESCKTNEFDLAIVDPPYGIISEKKSGGFLKDNFMAYGKGVFWDSEIPSSDYFHELFRISKNQIIWGGNYFGDHLGRCVGPVLWDKKTPKNFFADGELAWTSFGTGTLRIFAYGWAGFTAKQKLKRNKIHPCEKPVALYKWLLQKYAKPGQTIFDSHVGSGSIRIACHDMGFDFAGCELDQDYWRDQEDRYNNHISQGSLFDIFEIQNNIFKGE
jgi:site-specific DNA-methyltransferase (adenine-specific)